MESEVRYCTTTDGVRIAYTVTGAGSPHVLVSDPVGSHRQLLWSHPVIGRYSGEFARHNTLIGYDPRGTGLSDRVVPLTLDSGVWDLEAVIARTSIDTFALSAIQNSVPWAITFAARKPQRVTRLVIIDGFARMSDLLDTPQVRALLAAAEIDFAMATEALGAAAFGAGREESRDHGAFIRSCIGPEYFANAVNLRDWDVSEAAAQIKAPTLLVRHRGLQYVTEEMTRDLASRIPDCRLVEVDGLWADDPVGVARRIAEFINGDDPPGAVRERADPLGGLRTVLWTDLVGHTEMMQRLGDAKGRDVLREHERITRDTLKQHGGAEVKTMGDGFMASFGSVNGAMECAIALQRSFAERNESASERLEVRAGLNAGEPIEDEGDLFGSTVILASRIAAQASGGEILVSDVVRQLAAGKDFLISDRGGADLKGFDEPVRLFEVAWRVE
jgi:class 3 adenylate cyclase